MIINHLKLMEKKRSSKKRNKRNEDIQSKIPITKSSYILKIESDKSV